MIARHGEVERAISGVNDDVLRTIERAVEDQVLTTRMYRGATQGSEKALSRLTSSTNSPHQLRRANSFALALDFHAGFVDLQHLLVAHQQPGLLYVLGRMYN